MWVKDDFLLTTGFDLVRNSQPQQRAHDSYVSNACHLVKNKTKPQFIELQLEGRLE